MLRWFVRPQRRCGSTFAFGTVYQSHRQRVLESQYKDDVYMVTVVKPEGLGNLIDEEGTLMDHGKFSFDSTEEIAIETELEVEITGVGSPNGIS